MKSIKLNAANRAEIKEALLAAFAKNYFKDTSFEDVSDVSAAANKAFRKGMHSAWLKAYGAWSFHIDQVPKGLISSASFKVGVENEPNLIKALTDPKFPGKPSGVDILLTREEHDTMFADFLELDSLREKFRYDAKKFEKEVVQVLESVTTSRQLLEVWPTVEGYIPEHLYNPDKRFNLPAIRVEDLDAKLS
jgi:hypothetical protein